MGSDKRRESGRYVKDAIKSVDHATARTLNINGAGFSIGLGKSCDIAANAARLHTKETRPNWRDLLADREIGNQSTATRAPRAIGSNRDRVNV